MSDYVFIISRKGYRTNICAGLELISIDRLVEYINEDLKIVEKNKGKRYDEKQETHILNDWKKDIRVGKVDNKDFETRILKFLTLEEFEDIFKLYIEDIKPLLEYTSYGTRYFRKEILNKYGIKKG